VTPVPSCATGRIQSCAWHPARIFPRMTPRNGINGGPRTGTRLRRSSPQKYR